MSIKKIILTAIVLVGGLGAEASKVLGEPMAPKVLGNSKAPKGGTFNYSLGGEPTTINPLTSTDLYSRRVQGYIMEALLVRNEDTYEWEGALAEKWSTSKDGKEFTFVLRDGVKWQDGKPLTVEDVKFSFDAIFDDKYNMLHLRPYYDGLEKVEIVDAKTIKFTAKNKYFGNFDSAAELTIVPKHIYGDPEKGKKINREITGTGPYKLDKYEKGQRLVLVRNPEWWGTKVPQYATQNNYERIIMRFVKEENIEIEMLKKGDLDFIELRAEAYEKKAAGDEWGKKVYKVKTSNLAPVSYGYIGWNFKKDLFKDRDVRVGLAYLMNREEMIKKFLFGHSLPATGPWYQQSDYASKKVKATPYDPKKGLELFRKAGWSDSNKDGILDKMVNGQRVDFKFTLITANSDTMKYFTMYKEDAKKVGVDIEVKLVEWNTLIKLLDEKNFDAAALGWGGGSVDNDPKQIWHSSSAATGGSNFISYANPEVDKLIDEGREILDKKKRIKVWQQVYEKIADDAPYLFLFNSKSIFYAHTAKMKREKDTYKYAIGLGYWWIEE